MCSSSVFNREANGKGPWDESGSTASEWVVAAAIVGLFSIPVIALINSGAQSSSEPVVAAMDNPEEASNLIGYGEGREGRSFGAVNPNGAGEAEEEEPENEIAGLNKGVGYDISEADIRGGDRGVETRFSSPRRGEGAFVAGRSARGSSSSSGFGRSAAAQRSAGASPSAKAGPAGSANATASRAPGPRPTTVPVFRPADPVVTLRNRRALAEEPEEEIAALPSPRSAPVGAGAPGLDQPGAAAAPEAVASASHEDCLPPVESKSVRTEEDEVASQDELNEALVDTIDESKIDALLDNVRIRILEEAEDAPISSEDCLNHGDGSLRVEGGSLEDGILGTAFSASASAGADSQRSKGQNRVASLGNRATPGFKNNGRRDPLPIPEDLDALAKIIEESKAQGRVAALSGSGGGASNKSASDRMKIVASASAAFGETIIDGYNIAFNNIVEDLSLKTVTGFVSSGAKSYASFALTLDLPEPVDVQEEAASPQPAAAGQVPILRSGR